MNASGRALARRTCGGLVRGLFPALEAALFAQARELRGSAPHRNRLQPFAVIVPNAMLRLHLSRALAESGLAHANIHFLTLRHLADRLAGARLATEGRSAFLDEGVEMGAAIAAAARELEARLEYFRPVAHQEGFHSALLETFRDLKNAGVRPQEMQRAVQRMSARRDGILRSKLAEIALLWERIERTKGECRLYDEADLFEAAAREAERSPWLKELAQFIVYGFYDLTGAQQRLLAACFARAPATVYFPFADLPAYRYARPALDWFRAQGFQVRSAECGVRSERLPGAQAVASTPHSTLRTPHSEVLIISAPGEAREVADVAREVLHGPPSDCAGTLRIGILLRSPGAYVELLHEAFASAQVRAHFARGDAPPLSRTPAGRALANLAGLVGGPLRRAEVMDFVTGAPLKPAESLFNEPPAAEWNAMTIRAGIVEGRREWKSRLDNLVRSTAAGAAKEKPTVLAFRAFLKRLFDGLETVAAQRTWRARTAALAELYRALIAADDSSEAALAALDALFGLDALGEPPTPDRFRARVRDLLAEARPELGAFERNEPTVVSLMAARGVPFDLVIVPGLVEKSFPQPARQDPILLDAEREELAALLARAGRPADIPRKARRREEEELLFALAVQSARRRLVLTFPRLDAATARERVPSHFLLRMLETLRPGRAPDYRELDQFIRAHGRFVRMTRFDPKARDRAVTALEYDLAAFGKAERDRTPDALLYLWKDERRFFARALEAESARWGDEKFSKYDGIVQSPDLARALGKRLYDDSRPVSPTRLEDYAACPFSYLLRHVFDLQPTDEPERAATISPQDRGSLVHAILWQFLSDAARDGALPLTEAHWPRLHAVASARFAEFERRGVTGYPMLWRIEQNRLLADLREFLDREVAGLAPQYGDITAGRGPFSPAHFEVRFGMPRRDAQESSASTGKPASLELESGMAIRFCGKIDRVDVDPAARRCRVFDYKTGANYLRLQDDSFHGGRALQLPIYLIAARLVFPDLEPEYAEYYYASRRGDWRKVRFTTEGWPKKAETLRFIVRTIAAGIRAGKFFPLPVEADCHRCELRLACGHGRFLEFKWKADAQATADFRTMGEIP